MTDEPFLKLTRSAAALLAAALLCTGGVATYMLVRPIAGSGGPLVAEPEAHDTSAGASRADTPRQPSLRAAGSDADAPLPDVIVPLSREAVARAGIIVAPVAGGGFATGLRLPGVVEPNAYRQVVVTPLVAGRLTQVVPALGDRVQRGRTMAEIYSPALAEAQTRYVAARALLGAHDQELRRTQKLVAIGAASRQELEKIHAEHAAQTAAVESARSQLELLGVPAPVLDGLAHGQHVGATTRVPAPLDGVVTERAANVGLNVDPATKLFTVVDLSSVWVVADVYERDFSRVRVGSDATITIAAYPQLVLRGRISYIDPQVSAGTRTAKARVEVPNPRGDLRLGMFADVLVKGVSDEERPSVPRSAVQNVGDRTVVYLANSKEPDKFVEREVRLGQSSGEHVEVAAGVHPGDQVVINGSFFIRAERERLGLRPPIARPSTNPDRSPSATNRGSSGSGEAPVQAAKIIVTEQGYEPAKISLRAGVNTRLTFLRTSHKTCATEVVFPSLNIKRALPLNTPVAIEFSPPRPGEIAFACGMNMFAGSIVAE